MTTSLGTPAVETYCRMSECFCKYGMAAEALWVMYFCVNCKNLLMKINGERVL